MATISINNFGGIAPRVHPTLLGENMATVAHNCILKSGKLVPLRRPSVLGGVPVSLENGLTDVTKAKTIYLWSHGDTATLLAWPGYVSVAPSNLARDKYFRLFVSGETGVGGDGDDGNHPCAYIWNSDYDFEENRSNFIVRHDMVKEMLPDAEAERAEDGAIDDSKTIYYVYFVQTWVDKYGYESGPSEPSGEVEMNEGDKIRFGAVPSAPSGAASRRVYVAIPGSSEQYDGFRFCFEQKATTAGAFDETTRAVSLEDAGETLPDLQSAKGTLSMVTKVPGNFYAGVERDNPREVRFSEVANFSIWHDSCVCTVDADVVALAVAMNTVFALTAGAPYAITGTSPDAMVASSIATPAACVSPKSVVTYNGAAFYAGADGYYMLQDSSPTAANVTEQMFGPREWEALHPSDCFAVASGTAIFLWFPTAGVNLTLNMKDNSSIAVSTHGVAARCACGGGPGGRPVVVGKVMEGDEA